MHLLALGGPTATGKTAMAVELAHALGCDILSADSRQVYRGLDLGTGKDLSEYRKFDPPVRYHLIDIVEAEEVYSLYQYQDDCYRAIEALARSGAEAAVMAGGTGMYMEAVLRRYRIANVPDNPALRGSLSHLSREELEAGLRAKDPALAARTDMSSRKRILRALEVEAAGGSAAVEFSRAPEVDFTCTVFVTRRDRTELRARIDARLRERLAAGMIEEVEGLLKRGVSMERLRLLGMEYREIGAYLSGEKDRESMEADLRHEIHLLAKRQETYFRGMGKRGLPVTWVEPPDIGPILSFWEKEKRRLG